MAGSISSKLFLLGQRLLTIICKNPRGLRPVLGCALSEAENHLDPSRDTARLPVVSLTQIADENKEPLETVVSLFPRITHSISTAEAVSLGVLLQKVKARRVFEFGTNRGISTTQLALNIGADGMVFTLDLPRQNRQTKMDIKLAGDLEVAHQLEKADLIPRHCLPRVTFLEQDSATLDESIYAGTMDAVFVDGAHVYEYVRNDSEKGWRMLRPGGVIIWHDFRPQTPDVMRYLLESDYKPSRVEGTTLAFAFKPLK
jgi:predicted O-methyltransferase YrrM